jgi:hypothetical protein
MSDKDLLIRLVEDNPDNSIVASMLVDELMEVEDRTRSEAERHVESVAQFAREAVLIRTAAELMCSAKWCAEVVTRAARAALEFQVPHEFRLLIVGGDKPPAVPIEFAGRRHHRCPVYVPVGAGWVMVQIAHERERRRAVRQLRRKAGR